MINRNSQIATVLYILLIGILIRLFSSFQLKAVNQDEINKVNLAQTISFNINNINFPIGNTKQRNPLLSSYLANISMRIFGETLFGARALIAILCCGSLLYIYLLVKQHLNSKTAILSLILLILSQYHISISRMVKCESAFFIFIPPILYYYTKCLNEHLNKNYIILGILFGLSGLAYEATYLLAILLITFTFLNKDYRPVLKEKKFYAAVLTSMIIISPYLIWSISNGFSKLSYENLDNSGISLRAFYLYFAEFIGFVSQFTNLLFYNIENEAIYLNINANHVLVSRISNEIPVVSGLFGILIFLSLIDVVRRKERGLLIKLCTFLFIGTIIIASVIAGGDSLFDDHWWASLSLFPGMILLSHVITQLSKEYCKLKYLSLILIITALFNMFGVISMKTSLFASPNYYQLGYSQYKYDALITEELDFP